MVIVDGDECDIFGTMLEAGIVDKNAIQIKYPKDGSYDWELYKEKHPEEFDENGEWIDIDEDTDSE